MADVLDPQPVLIAPEARQRRRARVLAEHRLGRRGALPGGGVPVLGAGVGAEAGVEGDRGVAGGEDAGQRGAAGGVGADAALVEAAAGEPAGGGRGADADHDRVAGDRRRRRRGSAPRPWPPPRAPSSIAPTITRTPSSRCSSANQAPSSAPRIGASGVSSASIIVTSTPSRRAVAATSWPMKPAPTIASRAPGTSSARRRPGVGQGPQVVDVLVAVEERQPPRSTPGRDQQLLVAQLGARVEHDRSGLGVEPLGAGAQQQLDLLLLIPPGRPVGDRLLLDRARQHLLGKRRPVVGRVGLGADHPHRRLVAAAAQGLGAALRREPAADDHDTVVSHHASSRTGVREIGPALVAGRPGRWSGAWCRPALARRLAPPERTR